MANPGERLPTKGRPPAPTRGNGALVLHSYSPGELFPHYSPAERYPHVFACGICGAIDAMNCYDDPMGNLRRACVSIRAIVAWGLWPAESGWAW